MRFSAYFYILEEESRLNMSFFTNLLVALFCMSVVFSVLAILFALIRLFTGALHLVSEPKASRMPDPVPQPVPATAAASAPAVAPIAVDQPVRKAVAGEIKLNNVDEKTAAMLMAIVSHESGVPLKNLIFKSVKQVDDGTAAAL